MKAFGERKVIEILNENDEKIKYRIEHESDDYILNVDEQTYVAYLADEFAIEPLSLDFDKITISEQEREISGTLLSSFTFADPDKIYKKQEITFHIPCSKNAWTLIRCAPNTTIMWGCEVFVEDSYVCFEILNLDENNPDYVKRESDEIIRNMKIQLKHQTQQISDYNNGLKSKIQQLFSQRKSIISKRKTALNSLGYPMKVESNSTNTYSIPLPKTRNKIKPTIQTTTSVEPTLDTSNYTEILNIINDAGKMIEKYPTSYRKNDEPQLRDAFLMTLQPYIDASVTGETFNKDGKTDILLRYKSNNIFVAECKIWHGLKEYLQAIDQLLSYLTWRDSKTALIIFVKNKEIIPVLKTIEEETKTHPNFISFESKNDESWLNFTFHLIGDKERKLKLAVLIFHLPQTD